MGDGEGVLSEAHAIFLLYDSFVKEISHKYLKKMSRGSEDWQDEVINEFLLYISHWVSNFSRRSANAQGKPREVSAKTISCNNPEKPENGKPDFPGFLRKRPRKFNFPSKVGEETQKTSSQLCWWRGCRYRAEISTKHRRIAVFSQSSPSQILLYVPFLTSSREPELSHKNNPPSFPIKEPNGFR